MNKNNFNKGQVSIEILAILGVVIVGAVIAGSMYINNIHKNTSQGDQLNSIVDQFGSMIGDDSFNTNNGSGSVPTCSDGIQNQGEEGVDCGGPCPNSCGDSTYDFFNSLVTDTNPTNAITSSNIKFTLDANTNVSDVKLTKLAFQKKDVYDRYFPDTTSCHPATPYTISGGYFILNTPIPITNYGADSLYHLDTFIRCDQPGTYKVNFYAHSDGLSIDNDTDFKPLDGFVVTDTEPVEFSADIISPAYGAFFIPGDELFLDSNVENGTPPYTYNWHFSKRDNNGTYQELKGINKTKEVLYFKDPKFFDPIDGSGPIKDKEDKGEKGNNQDSLNPTDAHHTYSDISDVLDTNYGEYSLSLQVKDSKDHVANKLSKFYYYEQYLNGSIVSPTENQIVLPNGILSLKASVNGGSGDYSCKWYSKFISSQNTESTNFEENTENKEKLFFDSPSGFNLIGYNSDCGDININLNSNPYFSTQGNYIIKLEIKDDITQIGMSFQNPISVSDEDFVISLSPESQQVVNDSFIIKVSTRSTLVNGLTFNNVAYKPDGSIDTSCNLNSTPTETSLRNGTTTFSFLNNSCSTAGIKKIESTISKGSSNTSVSIDDYEIYNLEPLSVQIISPSNNASFNVLDNISFTSSVSGGRDPVTCAWKIDGSASLSDNCNSFDYYFQDAGDHIISFTATDGDGSTSSDAVDISVLNASSVRIVSDNVYRFLDNINFKISKMEGTTGNPIISYPASGCTWYLNGNEIQMDVGQEHSCDFSKTISDLGIPLTNNSYTVSVSFVDGDRTLIDSTTYTFGECISTDSSCQYNGVCSQDASHPEVGSCSWSILDYSGTNPITITEVGMDYTVDGSNSKYINMPTMPAMGRAAKRISGWVNNYADEFDGVIFPNAQFNLSSALYDGSNLGTVSSCINGAESSSDYPENSYGRLYVGDSYVSDMLPDAYYYDDPDNTMNFSPASFIGTFDNGGSYTDYIASGFLPSFYGGAYFYLDDGLLSKHVGPNYDYHPIAAVSVLSSTKDLYTIGYLDNSGENDAVCIWKNMEDTPDYCLPTSDYTYDWPTVTTNDSGLNFSENNNKIVIMGVRYPSSFDSIEWYAYYTLDGGVNWNLSTKTFDRDGIFGAPIYSRGNTAVFDQDGVLHYAFGAGLFKHVDVDGEDLFINTNPFGSTPSEMLFDPTAPEGSKFKYNSVFPNPGINDNPVGLDDKTYKFNSLVPNLDKIKDYDQYYFGLFEQNSSLPSKGWLVHIWTDWSLRGEANFHENPYADDHLLRSRNRTLKMALSKDNGLHWTPPIKLISDIDFVDDGTYYSEETQGLKRYFSVSDKIKLIGSDIGEFIVTYNIANSSDSSQPSKKFGAIKVDVNFDKIEYVNDMSYVTSFIGDYSGKILHTAYYSVENALSTVSNNYGADNQNEIFNSNMIFFYNDNDSYLINNYYHPGIGKTIFNFEPPVFLSRPENAYPYDIFYPDYYYSEGSDAHYYGGGSSGSNCFKEGTLIYTPNGLVPIQKIRKGDIVYSLDKNTNNLIKTKVNKLLIHTSKTSAHTIELKLSNNTTLYVLENHAFYDPISKEFKQLYNLGAGDKLYSYNKELNKFEFVEITSKKVIPDINISYNLSIGSPHNYIANGVVVHNEMKHAPSPPEAVGWSGTYINYDDFPNVVYCGWGGTSSGCD